MQRFHRLVVVRQLIFVNRRDRSFTADDTFEFDVHGSGVADCGGYI